MGLKGNIFINSLDSLQDKIRPKWDWKCNIFSTFMINVGDKIRPKWDWKTAVAFRFVPVGSG